MKDKINVKPYSDEEILFLTTGKVTIAKSEINVINFINETYKLKSTNKKLYLGMLKDDVYLNIHNKLKINIKNYNISLKVDAVKHILKHHSNDKEYLRGQVPIENNDFLLIPLIINNYDEVYNSGTTKDGKPSITFKKQIEDTYYLVTYISDKNRNLEIQTMYKKRNHSLCLIQDS